MTNEAGGVMAKYVDGFVILVPKKKLDAYKKISKAAGKIWMEYGALEYRECVGDDLNIPFGLPFKKLTKAKSTDAIVFSWIVYKSKAHRNSVNKKVMKDHRMDPASMVDMPFDTKKMSWGGFKTFVDFES